jgi:hypothetical protein
MNANTIISYRAGTGRNQLASQTIAATTATAAVLNTDTVGTTATAVIAVPLQSAILGGFNPQSANANASILGPAYGRLFGTPLGNQTPYFNSDAFDGVPFRVRTSYTGVAVANGAASILIQLCLGSASLLGTNVVIGNSGAALATVAGGAWAATLVSEIIWTIGSGANGNIASRHSATITFLPTPSVQVVSDVIQTNATAAALTEAGLVFTSFVTHGNAAGGTWQCTEFALELV